MLPNNEFFSEIKHLNIKGTISFNYYKKESVPCKLAIIVGDYDNQIVVHYVEMEFHKNGKIHFDFPVKKGKHIVYIQYLVDSNYNTIDNALFINNFKFKN
jgi:hypothetical protein